MANNNRSFGLKKAYAQGHRIKATCRICNKPIYNRMVYAKDMKGGYYAHSSCSKKDKSHNWELCW